MTAADQVMALKALRVGLDAAIAQAESDLDKIRELTGSKSFETPFGPITLTRRKPCVRVIPDRLLEWCEVNNPDEIVTTRTVRSSYVKAMEDRLTIAGEDVVDRDGVVVDYARVSPGSEFFTAKITAEARADATAQVLARLDDLVRFAVTA